MAYYLLKTEPTEFSYSDLERNKIEPWDGVTNPVAQRNLASMTVGDELIIYHTGNEKAAVGLGKVVRAAYPDPSDPRGKRVLVDVAPAGLLKRPVTLAEIRANPLFETSPLVRMARLSVVPLAPAQYAVLKEP